MTIAQVQSGVTHLTYQVSWEKLPEDYPLPDEPVENTSQPLLAAALRESLELIGFLTPDRLVTSNLGICATVKGKTIVKAPDWFYAPRVLPLDPPRTRRSYTPRVEGDIPAVVIEFLSDTDGGEYSARPFYPYGKLWFYEQILQVPVYVIFEPESGTLEMRHLVEGLYQVQQPDENGRYSIAAMNLELGMWHGTKAERTGYWLRWWDENGNLLLWGAERLEQERQRAEQERQRAEQERQRAEQERQRAERLESYLRAQGINPDEIR